MKRIAITGGSGLLATNWALAMRASSEICLFTHRHDVIMNGVETRQVSLDDVSGVKDALYDCGAELVIHTAGMTNVDGCERQPKLAHVANVDLACNVATATRDLGVQLVHISTDHLFGGDKPLVDEEEPPNPMNVYGRTKLVAEQRVSEIDQNVLVVRTNFYGWGNVNRVSSSDWIIQSLQQGRQVTAFSDVHFTPTLIDDVVRAVNDLLDKEISGTVNVVGDERLSKNQFAVAVAHVFGLDEGLIKEGSIEHARLAAARPRDMSLSNRKLTRLLGRAMGTVVSGLQTLQAQMQGGRSGLLNKAVLGDTRGVA